MVTKPICVLILYLAVVWSARHSCPQWCDVLSQCIGSDTALCTCCGSSKTQRKPVVFCSQEQDCSFYGDCCNSSTTLSPLSSGLHPKWTCTSTRLDSDPYVLMVAHCSQQWAGLSTRHKCANATLSPVTSNTTRVTYSNQYCAICNGERPNDLFFWRQNYICSRSSANFTQYENATIVDLVRMCQFQGYALPKCAGCVTRSCDPRVIRTCPEGYADDTTALGCQSYSCPVVWEGNVYVNVDCAFCNGAPSSLPRDACAKNYSFNDIELFKAIYFGTDPVVKNRPIAPVTFSLLLDLQNSAYLLTGSDSSDSSLGGDLSSLCGAGQVFVPPSTPDMELGYCQDQVCLPGEVRVGTDCLAMECPGFNTSAMSEIAGGDDMSAACFNKSTNVTCIQLHANDTHLASIVQHYGPLDRLEDGYVGTSQSGDVYKFNSTFYYCSNYSALRGPAYADSLGLVVLTYVGGAGSIIGCVLLLVTYSLFRELRTLPGKLLMNLAAAILASDVTLIGLLTLSAHIASKEYCTTVAIILHFTFLSRFSWMSVIAFHLLSVFSKPFSPQYLSQSHKLQVERKVLLCALASGWLLPLLIVVACVSLHFSADVIGYGENARCWIAQRDALIGGFIVPAYLSVLFNIVCFAVVCWSIFCATHRHKAHTRTQASHVRVYISLGVLMGLTWPSGFVAMLVNSVVPWYFFVALNSTQGLLLSIMFVCTKRNAGLYRSLCMGVGVGKTHHSAVMTGVSTTSLAIIKAPDSSSVSN